MPRTVALTDAQAELLDRLLATGAYKDASEAVDAALRLVEQTARDDKARIAAFEAAIEEGERDIREGRYTVIASAEDREAFMRSLDARA